MDEEERRWDRPVRDYGRREDGLMERRKRNISLLLKAFSIRHIY